MTAPSRVRLPGRANGWPVHRTPRWAVPAVVVLVGIAVAVGLAHRPSRSSGPPTCMASCTR